jgi:hypothetical protein
LLIYTLPAPTHNPSFVRGQPNHGVYCFPYLPLTDVLSQHNSNGGMWWLCGTTTGSFGLQEERVVVKVVESHHLVRHEANILTQLRDVPNVVQLLEVVEFQMGITAPSPALLLRPFYDSTCTRTHARTRTYKHTPHTHTLTHSRTHAHIRVHSAGFRPSIWKLRQTTSAGTLIIMLKKK